MAKYEIEVDDTTLEFFKTYMGIEMDSAEEMLSKMLHLFKEILFEQVQRKIN